MRCRPLGCRFGSAHHGGHRVASGAEYPSSGEPDRRKLAGIATVCAATVGWGFTGILVKLMTLSALTVSFYRMWLNLAVLFGIVLIRRPRRFRLTWLAVAGGVFYALDVSLFFASVKVTSIADAAFIGSLQPILVLFVAAPWFNEVIGRREVFVTLAAVAGVAFVLFGSPGVSVGSYVGDLLALAAVLAYTGYWLLSKLASRASDALDYTAGTVLVAALFLTPVVAVSGSSLVSDRPVDWLWLFVLVVTSGSANLAMNWAHRVVDLSVSSVILVGNPLVAASGALIILGQPITALQLVGGLVTIVAIYMMVTRTRSTPSGDAPLAAL